VKAFAVARDDSPAIRLIEAEEPRPRHDEAVIAVDAFSLNRGETFLLESEAAGWRPGKDVSGSVVAACADGSGPAVGTRVVAHLEAGGWAELVAVTPDRLAERLDRRSLIAMDRLAGRGLGCQHHTRDQQRKSRSREDIR
jgi:NADPH:quinone reductase